MQQPGEEGARQFENGRNHGSMNGGSPQNSVLSALPPPMPSRKLGEQPSVGNNVESVITKAKKAAGSLYTLLHAKNCRLSADRCPHPGCAEAKLMYLHLKTCKAEGISCCPTNYKGCVDARKLINHYRRCRDIRSRKTGGQGNGKSEPHFCLVCSLVARNAKSKSRSISPNGASTRQPQKQQMFKQEVRVRPRSFSFSEIGRTSAKPTIPRELVKTMPPPPPRFSAPNPQGGRVANNDSNNNGMDVQTTMSSALAVHRSETRDASNNARPRAESLDLQKASLVESSSMEEQVQQPSVGADGFHVPVAPIRRRRSASFHVLSAVNPSGFQTIEEEPVGEELQEILEGDRS